MNSYCHLKDRTIISIRGKDKFAFLQSMITNDLSFLEHKPVIYTLFLSPTGRFLYDAFIINYNDSYLLDVNAENSTKFIQRLNLYKLKSNLEIEDQTAFFDILYLKNNFESELCYKDPRYWKLGYRYISPKNTRPGDLNENLYYEDKYEYCIPDGFIDYIQDRTLPPEYDFEKLFAVSYTKGCYIGQEVISRAKYQGIIRKKLYKLIFDQEVSNLFGQEILQNGMKVGIITSSWKNFSISLLRIELLNLDSYVEVGVVKGKILEVEWNR